MLTALTRFANSNILRSFVYRLGFSFLTYWPQDARIAQLVEHDLAKVGVAGSSPVSRSAHY